MEREKLSFLITIALLCTTPAFAAGGRVYPESATQVIGPGGTEQECMKRDKMEMVGKIGSDDIIGPGGTEQDFKKHGGNITPRGTITLKDAVLTPVK